LVFINASKSILFSRKYHKGLAGKSYGLHVAKLAGIPDHIIKRAQNILEHLEKTK
jgi:DNA mismatch repair protein MutS